jgi:fatty acyl-ACP thioesterase B
MPEEVRAEISPYFLERSAIKDDTVLTHKILRLNDDAECVRSGLTVSCCLFHVSVESHL